MKQVCAGNALRRILVSGWWLTVWIANSSSQSQDLPSTHLAKIEDCRLALEFSPKPRPDGQVGNVVISEIFYRSSENDPGVEFCGSVQHRHGAGIVGWLEVLQGDRVFDRERNGA